MDPGSGSGSEKIGIRTCSITKPGPIPLTIQGVRKILPEFSEISEKIIKQQLCLFTHLIVHSDSI